MWRDELRSITSVVLKLRGDDDGASVPRHRPDVGSRDEVTISPAEKATRKTQYSTETGRIVPTSSKTMTSRKRWTPNSSGGTGSRDQHRLTYVNEETQADELVSFDRVTARLPSPLLPPLVSLSLSPNHVILSLRTFLQLRNIRIGLHGMG